MTFQKVDLHTHSTASDGVFAPSEVVALARRHRVEALALTDHDTTQGLAEAQAAGEAAGIVVLPGIEMATVQPNGKTIDLLGYCFDPNHTELQEKLTILRTARRERAAQMVAKLNALGLPVDLERVYALAGRGSVARPHVAAALVEAGHVATLQQAFDLYIGNDGPAYVPHHELPIEDAIALLHRAGGVAVLAHPIRVPDFEARIGAWVAAGLDGLEVYYPDHGPLFTMTTRVIARRYDLIATGGSDFHRPEDGEIKLGSQPVPGECVAQLQARAARYR
ncbi:MAG: PHP domain-containing protein [Anaerolineae bacterium]